MVINYEYENKITSPNLDDIHLDVSASDMVDKSIEYCRWDEKTQLLKVIFTNELSSGDKNKLDIIISNNL